MKNNVLIRIALFLLVGAGNVFAQNTPVLVFEQTPCFGSCAVFKMELFQNRKLKLQADKYVSVGEGHFSSKIKRKEYKRLVKLFYTKEFFKLQDEYTSRVSDLPSKYITFNDGVQSKTVLDYTNAPVELIELEKELFLVLSKSKWKKSN